MKLRKIEMLEKDVNKKGDLFGRLMADLFHSLGYGESRLNIHKTGREIDLQASHRTENRIAVAEFKAHKEPIGGSDINKFVGALNSEKIKLANTSNLSQNDIVGYFISLSGFKESAIEQELEVGNNRVILIEPEQIVNELVLGKVIISKEEALSRTNTPSQIEILEHYDLLAYERGWTWVFYYSNCNKQCATHCLFVHAEGEMLISSLAEEIINRDIVKEYDFSKLICLNLLDKKSAKDINKTKDSYFKYLKNELGEIHFEGMPTDKESGSVRVDLESIFVPLHFEKMQGNSVESISEIEEEIIVRESIGDILKKESQLAILAKPGGGKSTLLKRLAIAYAYQERKLLIDDNLPENDWFPIFVRCREIGDSIGDSITEIIQNIPNRAEINWCLEEFSELSSQALQNGNALLLIDGLDEITDDKKRINFINQVRTFIGTYPQINIIVTSREAGFRVVAGILAPYCTTYIASDLSSDEINELCLKWHKAIIDNSEKTIKEARKLSKIIVDDNRIRALAENPLLLTTLLFVRRWAGYLPTKRSVLYQEMIKLLLVTWNVEGHEILDIDETEPQLSFVAYWMTCNGRQNITYDELKDCLINARKQMPEILGYTNISPAEFIRRVELRSSLVIMSGHKTLESGMLTPVYEFLHLSFQEYLTAKAIVKGYIPITDTIINKVDLLKDKIQKENWKEVIPLVSVLLERDTKDLIELLINESKDIPNNELRNFSESMRLAPLLLGNCIANEIQISPELLEESIEWYCKNIYTIDRSAIYIILKSKFGSTFREFVRTLYFVKYDDQCLFTIGSIMADIYIYDNNLSEHHSELIETALILIKNDDKESKCIALHLIMNYAFRSFNMGFDSRIKEALDIMLPLIKLDDVHFKFVISWCCAWIGSNFIIPSDYKENFACEIIKIWISDLEFNYHRVSSWALSRLLEPSMVSNKLGISLESKDIIMECFNEPKCKYDQFTSLYLGTLIKINFNREKIEEIFSKENDYDDLKKDMNSSYSQFQKALKL